MKDRTRGHRRRALVVAAIGCVAALVAAPAAIADAPTQEAQDVRQYQVGPPTLVPEDVVYDEGTDAFYGGALASGVIYKATLDGAPAETFLQPGVDGTGKPDLRAEALGMVTDDQGRLYVGGGASGRIHVYDLASRAQVATFETGPGGLVNDLTLTEDGDVYVTDSLRPRIYRITADQVEAGSGTPEIIDLAPEVTNSVLGGEAVPLPFNANGIRVTPDGRHIVFNDLNDGKLYRMTPPPPGDPAAREIEQIDVEGAPLGSQDGLEFVDGTLYAVDNFGERILTISLAEDHLSGTVESVTTSPDFHTPTAVSPTPDGRLLVNSGEFFDPTGLGPPFYVTSIPRP